MISKEVSQESEHLLLILNLNLKHQRVLMVLSPLVNKRLNLARKVKQSLLTNSIPLLNSKASLKKLLDKKRGTNNSFL
jgi:hypothetical protein